MPEFKSDGCTLWPVLKWQDPEAAKACCDNLHDRGYWEACLCERKRGWKARKDLDDAMWDCIVSYGHPLHAWWTWFWARTMGWVVWYSYGRCRETLP